MTKPTKPPRLTVARLERAAKARYGELAIVSVDKVSMIGAWIAQVSDSDSWVRARITEPTRAAAMRALMGAMKS